MSKPILTGEQKTVLRALSPKTISVLYKLTSNQEQLEALRVVLTTIMTLDEKLIVKNTGAFSSLDTMINNLNEQQFRRGRMSFGQFLSGILNAVPYRHDEIEQEAEKGESNGK